MPEINLDNLPKRVSVADIIALLGEDEAIRLVAGIKAKRVAPSEHPTLDQIVSVRKLLDDEPADSILPSAARGLRVWLRQPGSFASRRRTALLNWLHDEEVMAGGSNGQEPRPRRTRRPITDPEALEKRRQALAKARAARKAIIEERRAAEAAAS